ncbi:hypothetical protein [Streptomyces sp. RKAG293]|uniref:hypothetical protein n=1 Tax=Streptomyces sp. RKAG293 TaxID=2893403 RepID=UPI002033DD40|nr:hypothetical protein [Streptomyces sp. RKAG293]MCM2417745.1 hypothetical protein [Streptomyces sp. RKAG293]
MSQHCEDAAWREVTKQREVRMDGRELIRAFRKRPGMFIPKGDPLGFDQAVTFLLGMDVGSGDALLFGFREFLVLKLGEGHNLTWSGLVVRLTVPVVQFR